MLHYLFELQIRTALACQSACSQQSLTPTTGQLQLTWLTLSSGTISTQQSADEPSAAFRQVLAALEQPETARPAALGTESHSSGKARPESKPPDPGTRAQAAANDWIDQHVLPAINAQVRALAACVLCSGTTV